MFSTAKNNSTSFICKTATKALRVNINNIIDVIFISYYWKYFETNNFFRENGNSWNNNIVAFFPPFFNGI